MNSVKIGLELKKLVFKRKLGGGEFSYVSFATGEERRGKSEILELLQKESGWNNLLSCKSSSETEFSFMKKVKKQISFVLFEDQAAEATLCKNVPDADSGSKEHEVNCDLPNATIEVFTGFSPHCPRDPSTHVHGWLAGQRIYEERG